MAFFDFCKLKNKKPFVIKFKQKFLGLIVKMKILFILPRYHTNYIEVFKSLLIKGYKIKLCVYNFGLIENHKYIKPEYVNQVS